MFAPKDGSAQIVFAPDNRARITPTTVQPYYWVCTMWNGYGNLPAPAEEFLFYTISTTAGQSGSAVRRLINGKNPPGMPWLVGVHVAGDPDINSNFAVRLNQDNIAQIDEWL